MTDTPRYAVKLFTHDGKSDFCLNMGLAEAEAIAESRRPALGASYVYDETRRLVFKPYRRPRPPEYSRYEPTNTRRLSRPQIESAAKRFELDGEHENAASMRALAT